MTEQKSNSLQLLATVAVTVVATLAAASAFINDAGGWYSYFYPNPKVDGEFYDAEFRVPSELIDFGNMKDSDTVRKVFDFRSDTANSGDFIYYTSLNLKNLSNFTVKDVRVKLPVFALGRIGTDGDLKSADEIFCSW